MVRIEMKIAVLTACCAALALFASPRSDAATTAAAGVRVGYVDLLSVQERAIPVRKAIDDAERKIAPLQKQAEEKLQELEALQNAMRNPSLLSKSDLEKKVERANKLKEEADLLVYKANRELAVAMDQTTSEAGRMIVKAIEAVARQRGLAMVLSKDSLLWAADSCDMTQDVVSYLNAGQQSQQTSVATPNSLPLIDPGVPSPGGAATLAPQGKAKTTKSSSNR